MQGKMIQPQTLKKIHLGLFGFCSGSHQITAACTEHHKLISKLQLFVLNSKLHYRQYITGNHLIHMFRPVSSFLIL